MKIRPLPGLILLTAICILPACKFRNSSHIYETKKTLSSEFNIDDLQRRAFSYFWDLSDPESGLIPDRWPTESFCSIAAMGFGLTSYIVGIENGYISRKIAAERIRDQMKFLYRLPQSNDMHAVGGYKGFFYHFIDMKNGTRYKDVELSTVDTGWLMAGILSCQSYFDGNDPTEIEIRNLADSLYRRVEWDWFLNDNGLLSMGWFPDRGFLKAQWDGYNEAMLLVIMALGSPTHPVPADCWDKWTKPYIWADFYGYEMVNFGPLFGHQYSHMYVDFRGIYDKYMESKGIDYFENARRATYSNRAYCIANPLHFSDYSDTIWGLTACDGPGYRKVNINGNEIEFMGYAARGAAVNYHVDDGTIAPTAAGGSIPFAPEICIPALKAMYEKYGSAFYDTYGFRDAFNPTFTFGPDNENGWFDRDYIGIDQGPIVIMIENYKTGLIWKIMKKNKYIIDGLKKAGFKGEWLDNH
jgi:hypothetical protein